MTPSFGIDFGTTNTRVAYFDGKAVQLAAFSGRQGEQVYQLPTAIAYRDGRPVASGYAAFTTTPAVRFPVPLKWSLTSEEAIDLGDGQTKEPIEAVADFLRSLRQAVLKSFPKAPLEKAAVTIPVHYPPAARARLHTAFRHAGIEVTHFFFEPIAAIYAGLIGQPTTGVSAVFDWGGGSLDVAAVEVRDGIARTREVDGWHRGGTHFDRMIAEQSVNGFLNSHTDDPMISTLTAEGVLDRTRWGRLVLDQAVRAKEVLSQREMGDVTVLDFLNHGALEYELTRPTFADLIRADLCGGIARLARVLDASGVTPRTLSRLFLSGGTCNVREVRERLGEEYAAKLTASLRLPPRLVPRSAGGGLDDIGNATAIGAALLAGQGAAATFAASVGVRLAGAEGEGRFLPVFRQGDPVRFDHREEVRLFVTNTSGGVARLLVCEQTDDVTQPSGRLLKVITVPVVRSESWLRVGFRVDRHLTLQVRAVGVKNFNHDHYRPTQSGRTTEDWVQSLKLGFQLPTT